MTHDWVRHPVVVRRTGLLIGGWALATVLALVLGLQSVSAISDSVTGRPRKTLSPSSVRAALDRSTSSDDSSSSESTDSTDDSRSSSGSSGSNGSASSGSTGPGGGDDGSSSSASASDGQPSSDGDGDNGSSSSQAFPPSQDQSIESQGGTVTVRFENGEAHLLFMAAATGFSCEDNSNSSTVDVRCKSITGSHESRITAFWDNGPQHTVEEKD